MFVCVYVHWCVYLYGCLRSSSVNSHEETVFVYVSVCLCACLSVCMEDLHLL